MLFPGATRPLHIFEARYREMVADALEGDRLIGMVMLQPGYEADYEGRPPVHPVGCVGVIAEATELPDGRYNILLGGLTKFRIVREDDSRAYRLADVEPISDAISAADRNRLRDVREDLAALIPLGIPGLQVPDGLDDEDLVNGISQLIDIAPADRLGLLEQPGPLARAEALIDLIYIRSALPAVISRRPTRREAMSARRAGTAAEGGEGADRGAVKLFVYLWAPFANEGTDRRAVTIFVYLRAPFAKRAPTDTP